MRLTTNMSANIDRCGRCDDRIHWNGQKWTTVDEPVGPCLPGLGYDHQPATTTETRN